MIRILSIALLSTTLLTPALAAEKSANIGINVSLDNAYGIHGEFNLQKPLSLQIFYKNYSRSYYYGNNFGNYSYSYTALGAAGLYDFSKAIRFSDRKIHPYAGLGLFTVTSTFNGNGGYVNSPVNGGLYITAGARYELTPEVDFDGNYNNFGGLTIGANFKF